MNIMIFGTKKSADTRKAERWFKERSIPFQVRRLDEKGISPGELDAVARAIPFDELIDEKGPTYTKKGYAYMEFDPREEILEEPLLLRMPVVRHGKRASAGYDPDTWSRWVKEEKGG